MPEMTSQFSGDTTGRCPVGEGPTNTKEGLESFRFSLFPLLIMCSKADGGIAQLARASALQAEGQGFESPYLHISRVFRKEAVAGGI